MALFLTTTAGANMSTAVLPRWTGWLASAAASLLSLACVPTIYGGRDFLQAVVVGGDAPWGAYSYVSSLAGIAFLIWLLSRAVWMPAVGTHLGRGQPSGSGTGG